MLFPKRLRANARIELPWHIQGARSEALISVAEPGCSARFRTAFQYFNPCSTHTINGQAYEGFLKRLAKESGIENYMDETIKTAPHIALLAPVPLEDLNSGKIKAEEKGGVAFGSRAWELFRELDTLRKGMHVDVYIYASSDPDSDFEVSWHARYVSHVESGDP